MMPGSTAKPPAGKEASVLDAVYPLAAIRYPVRPNGLDK